MRDLTEFQKNVITVLVGDAKYGLEVKESLERYYRDEVNHGRLYPNLDKLVEEGYVEKRARDERTNEYVLTDEARDEIRDDILWRVENYVDGSDDRASDIRDAVEDV